MMLIVLVIFGLLAGYYYFLYTPILEDIDQLEARKATLDKEINDNLALLRKKPELEARYAELEYLENDELWDRISSIDEMLQILNDESEKSGIKILSFVPTRNESTTEIEMKAEGYYSDLVLFLEGINSLDGQIEFESINVYKKSEENNLLGINGKYIFDHELFIGGEQT